MSARTAIVLAVDLDCLVREAQRVDGVIAFAPRVGDFVAVGEPLFLLYGGAAAIHTTAEHKLGRWPSALSHYRAGLYICLPSHRGYCDQGAIQSDQ